MKTLSQSALMYASLPNCDILDKKIFEDIPEPNFYYWLATDVPTDFKSNFLSCCNKTVWIKFNQSINWMTINQSINQLNFSTHNVLGTINYHITINVLFFNRNLYVHVKCAG